MLHSKSYIAIPPGVTIKEQIEDRGLTQKEFACHMDLTEKHISKLINGDVALTPQVALRLESVLGIPASFWNNLEAKYEEQKARVKDELEMEQDIELSKKFPYSKIAALGWVKSTKIYTERVQELRAFFEVANLGVLEKLQIPGIAYRVVAEKENNRDYALAAWAQKAKLEARKVPVSPINIDKLKNSVGEIRQLTVTDPRFFCGKLQDVLAKCGVAIVFLPHIGGSFLHGASFIDGKHIVLALTLRGKYADKFWFSLFHELCHIIDGHINLESTSEEQETEADEFAQKTLIPSDKYSAFVKGNVFTQNSILSFSRSIGIDPGIVVGRLQKEYFIRFSSFNNLKTKYELT